MSKISECQNCNRSGWACLCPSVNDDDEPICKDKGGAIGMNGECLYCTVEQGEACK